ncbi:MAG: TetR/AcrR family transcriptional regulator [Deltaproteobacteria bacterium]|nr:MAG: TetR/AcrR family transcriptional regulator [Deltaproteobacteria bacterium]
MNHETTLTPRRQRKRQARIDRILEAATDLLSREGVRGLTLQRLADELDYTVGAFYRYFDSKEHLLAEVERRIIGRITERVEAALEATRDLAPPLLPFFVLTEVYARLPRTMPAEFGLVAGNIAIPEHVIPDDAEARVVEVVMPLLRRAAAFFDAAVTAGVLAPGDGPQRAMIFWSGVHGAVQLAKLDRLEGPFAQGGRLPRRTTRALLAGFGASEEALDAAESTFDAWLSEHSLDDPARPARTKETP